MCKFKIVILDTFVPLSDIESETFSQIGAEVVQANVATPEEIWAATEDADAVMTVAARLTAEVIAGFKKVKVIGRYGVGLDNVDLEAATEHGIIVTYAPVYCQEEVATLAVTLLLAAERRIFLADAVVKGGNWKGSVPAVEASRSLQGKVLGLVGFGAIARMVVPKMQPFGCEVIAYDPYMNFDFCEQLNVKPVELDDLLRNADYVSLHVPLLPSTRHMIDAPQLAMMKKDAILINTARGGLVNQAELVKAVREGRIAGAGLDVLEFEPPDPADPVFSDPRIITTGHIGAATQESVIRLRHTVADQVVDALYGKCPACLGNPAIKEKLGLR
jgi:D-3-phosphoglycerate dehydrogenase